MLQLSIYIFVFVCDDFLTLHFLEQKAQLRFFSFGLMFNYMWNGVIPSRKCLLIFRERILDPHKNFALTHFEKIILQVTTSLPGPNIITTSASTGSGSQHTHHVQQPPPQKEVILCYYKNRWIDWRSGFPSFLSFTI